MDFRSNFPLYLQVIDDIKKQIITGALPLGSRLPSTRELALLYQINPNTAVRIYNELEMQGITFTKRGIGTFICEDPHLRERLKNEMAQALTRELVTRLKDIGYSIEELQNLINCVYSNYEEE